MALFKTPKARGSRFHSFTHSLLCVNEWNLEVLVVVIYDSSHSCPAAD